MMEETKNIEIPTVGEFGEKPVGLVGIGLIAAYLILFSILLLISFFQFFPSSTSAGGSDSVSPVTFIFWTFSVSNEIRLFIIVTLAGALGSLIHALRSFYKYVGHRDLKWSWVAMYILLPFIGAILGLIFYLIIRGGFFSTTATAQQTSPFGFAALSALAGLFTEQTVRKLKDVAGVLLTKSEEGKDPLLRQK